MGITIDEAIKRYNSNAFYEKSDGNLQGYLEFRQLAEWLEKLQKITEIVETWKSDVDIDSYDCMTDIYEVLEDGECK